MAVNHNVLIKAFSEAFCNEFTQIFGSFKNTPEKFNEIEDWFNSSIIFLSLLTGISLQPVAFNEENRHHLLLHIYSISYVGALRMAKIVDRPITLEFGPNFLTASGLVLDLAPKPVK